MKSKLNISILSVYLFFSISCINQNNTPNENAFTELLSNQVNEVILPTFIDYYDQTSALSNAAHNLSLSISEQRITEFVEAYKNAYTAYQRAAVHNYFSTENQALVRNTNLYPIDIDVLNNLIENNLYNFSTTSQERANGFPALDYLIFGNESESFYELLSSSDKTVEFIIQLCSSINDRANRIVEDWSGSLKDNFIQNGGTALGSSISVQLNNSLIYYEEHIRENKAGLPIGLIGPNDSPIPADPTKIEAYHNSVYEQSEDFTLLQLKTSVEEMENIYLGGIGQGYDDLLIERAHTDLDQDIKDLFQQIYFEIEERQTITQNTELYETIQELVTLYKSDLLPILNVQDADGASDGD